MRLHERRFLPGIVMAAMGALPAQPADPGKLFAEKVRPIFAARCVVCHGEKTRMSGLNLTSREAFFKGGTRGPAVTPDAPEQSILLRAVEQQSALKMPP